TGAEVKEGDWYKFTALGLSADEKVENWYINGNKEFFATDKTFNYNVKKSDAGTGKVIDVTFKKKTALKPVLNINNSVIECKEGINGTGATISAGSTVKEGEYYQFKALLGTGETVKNWVVNGKPNTYETKTTFLYKVRAADISSDNKLTVSFVKN
ncbi:MAG: hypothetical protein ACTTH8_08025, partial [Treponema sp.]